MTFLVTKDGLLCWGMGFSKNEILIVIQLIVVCCLTLGLAVIQLKKQERGLGIIQTWPDGKNMTEFEIILFGTRNFAIL